MMLFSPSFQFGTNLDSWILVQRETSSQVGRVQLRTTSLRITKYSLRTTKDSTTGVLPAGLMGLVVALAGHGSERARNQKSSTHQDKDRQPAETNEDRDQSQLFGWQGAAVSRNSKGQKSHEGAQPPSQWLRIRGQVLSEDPARLAVACCVCYCP